MFEAPARRLEGASRAKRLGERFARDPVVLAEEASRVVGVNDGLCLLRALRIDGADRSCVVGGRLRRRDKSCERRRCWVGVSDPERGRTLYCVSVRLQQRRDR